jgi:hypothetical protein
VYSPVHSDQDWPYACMHQSAAKEESADSANGVKQGKRSAESAPLHHPPPVLKMMNYAAKREGRAMILPERVVLKSAGTGSTGVGRVLASGMLVSSAGGIVAGAVGADGGRPRRGGWATWTSARASVCAGFRRSRETFSGLPP